MTQRQLRRTAAGPGRQNAEDLELGDDVELPQGRSTVPPSNAAAAATASSGSDSDSDSASDSDAEGAAADGEDATAASTRSGSRSGSRGPVTPYTRANKNARSQMRRLFKHLRETLGDIASKYEPLAADSRIINTGQPIMGYFFVSPVSSHKVEVELIGADAMTLEQERQLRNTLCRGGTYAQAATHTTILLTGVSNSVAS